MRYLCGLCGFWSSHKLAPVIRERVLSGPNRKLDIQSLLVLPKASRLLTRTYQLVGRLGEGGFASVFQATYFPTGEQRAVKVMRKPDDLKHLHRLVTEVQLLIQLDHPNIMKLHEFFEDERSIYIVSELCEGGDLSSLNAQSDDIWEFRSLYRDVLGAIDYCHSEGIAHRDLKFENCMLVTRNDGHRRVAKVIDFGLASVRQAGDMPHDWMTDAVGTAYFVAPEVLCAKKLSKYGTECDMWSFGVMLYIALTDHHPFCQGVQSLHATLDRIRKSPLRITPLDAAAVEPAARDLLVRLLARDPGQRLTARAALEHTWFRCSGLPVSSYIERTPKPSAREVECMLDRAESFAHFSRFEKAILTLVAHESRAQDFEDTRAAFALLDPAHAGWLSGESFRSVLAARGIAVTTEDFRLLLQALDPNGTDKIHYTDWLAATLEPSSLTSKTALEEVFDFFDFSGKGVVFSKDLREAFGDDAAAVALMQTGSRNKSHFSYDEFGALMLGVACKLEEQQRRHSLRKIPSFAVKAPLT